MDKLWEIVEKEHLPVVYEKMSELRDRLHGLYIYHPDTGPCIILDTELIHFRRLHRCVLAEEIGHYYTAPRTNLLQAHGSANVKTMMNQDELRALQWATDFLISDRALASCLTEGYRSCYELAEQFDVTEWFMKRKMLFWKM